MQHWFNLSDPGVEEALYDSASLRQFAQIDLGREPVPDESTVVKFRHLMGQHNLGDQLFHHVNVYLAENGMKLSGVFRADLIRKFLLYDLEITLAGSRN